MSDAPRIWPLLLASAIGVAILCALGIWQLDRLHWNQTLLADIAARQTAAPAPLADLLAADAAGADIEFRRLAVTARFLAGPELHLLTTHDGRAGWQIITPALTDDGTFLLVDRGVVPDELRSDPRRTEEVGVPRPLDGIVRLHRQGRGLFTPDNDPAANLWHWWDVPAMLAAAQPPAGVRIAPFVLQLLPETDSRGRFPRPLPPQAGLNNNHLQYALTWFSLAAILVVMTALFVRSIFKRGGA